MLKSWVIMLQVISTGTVSNGVIQCIMSDPAIAENAKPTSPETTLPTNTDNIITPSAVVKVPCRESKYITNKPHAITAAIKTTRAAVFFVEKGFPARTELLSLSRV